MEINKQAIMMACGVLGSGVINSILFDKKLHFQIIIDYWLCVLQPGAKPRELGRIQFCQE